MPVQPSKWGNDPSINIDPWKDHEKRASKWQSSVDPTSTKIESLFNAYHSTYSWCPATTLEFGAQFFKLRLEAGSAIEDPETCRSIQEPKSRRQVESGSKQVLRKQLLMFCSWKQSKHVQASFWRQEVWAWQSSWSVMLPSFCVISQRFILEMCWVADNRWLVNAIECVPSHTVSYIMLPLRLLQVLKCMICDLLRYFWRLQSWVSSILLIIENLALVTMEQLQRCLITMSFVHIHIMHRSPNAWTNATQIHPPYLLLERALPCVALVTPSEAWRLRTSSWKIFPDFFASQKKDAHIISHRDWKTVGFTFRCSGQKAFVLYTSEHHFSTDNRIESKWSLFFIFLVAACSCYVWSRMVVPSSIHGFGFNCTEGSSQKAATTGKSKNQLNSFSSCPSRKFSLMLHVQLCSCVAPCP